MWVRPGACPWMVCIKGALLGASSCSCLTFKYLNRLERLAIDKHPSLFSFWCQWWRKKAHYINASSLRPCQDAGVISCERVKSNYTHTYVCVCVRVGVCLVEWVCACMYYTTYMLQNSISYLRTMPLCPNANLK